MTVPSFPLHPPSAADRWCRIQVPAAPWGVGVVRASVRAALTRQGHGNGGELADQACLLASELVTNGVVHAKAPVSALLTCRPRGLRMEVYDPNGSVPRTRTASPAEEPGRGLALVDALAADWGTVLHPASGGKSVWFELG